MDTNLLSFVSSVHDRQFDGEIIVEGGKVEVASLINIDVRPPLLDIRRAGGGRWDILI